MKVVLVKEAWRNTGFLVDQALLPDSEFFVFMQGIPLFLGWHLGDATVAEMFIQLVVFALPVSRVELRQNLTEVAIDTLVSFFTSRAPTLLAPIS